MAGFFVKDIRLLLQRKKFFVMLLAISICLSFNSSGEFIIGYLTMVCSIFVLSTVSYDEYDNCYPFLMTLPASRKDYVKEKYLFATVISLISWMVGVTLYIIEKIVNETGFVMDEKMLAVLPYFPLAIILISLMLPFQLKYGSERGRVIMIGVFGGIAAIVFLIIKLLESKGYKIDSLLEQFITWKISSILIAICGITVVIALLSYSISVKIMQKKEF